MELMLKKMKDAFNSFSYLVNLDLKDSNLNLDVKIIDAIENGLAQKFEYTSELCWKLIKKFLFEKDGIDAKSPKSAVKEFYTTGYINEKDYNIMLQLIDSRNKLSHIYDEEEFKTIISDMKKYDLVFKKVIDIVEKSITVK